MSGRHASYLDVIFDQKALKKSLRQSRNILKGIEFDGLLARGNSGVVYASILALRMGKKLVIARKPDEKSHSSYDVENAKAGDRLIFVDDCICSGKTLTAATLAVLKAVDYDFTFAGCILYGLSIGCKPEFKTAAKISVESKIDLQKSEEARRKEVLLSEQKAARERLQRDSYKGNNTSNPYQKLMIGYSSFEKAYGGDARDYIKEFTR